MPQCGPMTRMLRQIDTAAIDLGDRDDDVVQVGLDVEGAGDDRVDVEGDGLYPGGGGP